MDEIAAVQAQMAAWQSWFHDCFDADPPSENDGPRPAEMGDLSADFRLLNGFAWLRVETRARCLSVLPDAAEITPLVEAWLGPAAPVDEAEATRLLQSGRVLLTQALDLPDTDVELWDALGCSLPERAASVERKAAVLFMTELMSWQGSSHAGAYHVGWALAEPDTINPVTPFVALEKGGWRVLEAGDAWLLEDRR